MFITAKELATHVADVWHKYKNPQGREKFQVDLGHALIKAGIKWDRPNIEDLKDPKKKHTPHSQGMNASFRM